MDEYIVGEYIVENSRSRSGRHRASSVLLIYSREKGFIPLSKAKEYIVEENIVKPTYVKGEARSYKLKLKKGDYVVYGWFVRNFLGKVKGYIEVYSYKGELLYRAKYYNGIVRKSIGNPVNAWLIRLFLEKTRIPVKKTRLGDENV
ncbi:MAG: hypothetical protein B6U89_06890 [Desulfurococcales archaeon ex4484_58]|nr:MAG: hypothetical protein B6U89_06890 [Desulfurococcales archaeon ex4484_58]